MLKLSIEILYWDQFYISLGCKTKLSYWKLKVGKTSSSHSLSVTSHGAYFLKVLCYKFHFLQTKFFSFISSITGYFGIEDCKQFSRLLVTYAHLMDPWSPHQLYCPKNDYRIQWLWHLYQLHAKMNCLDVADNAWCHACVNLCIYIVMFLYNGLLFLSQFNAFNTWPLKILESFSTLTKFVPEIKDGGGKILQVCSYKTGTLQIAPLIFLCWPLGITTIFLKTILCAIRICSSFSSVESFQRISSTYRLLYTAWQGRFPFETLEWQVLQIYSLSSKDFVSVKRCSCYTYS